MDEIMFRVGSHARKPHSSVRLKPLRAPSISEVNSLRGLTSQRQGRLVSVWKNSGLGVGE